MRYLGVDYGISHIGLAIGDDELYIASPFNTISKKKEDNQSLQDIFAFQIESLKNIIISEDIDIIVIGLPKQLQNKETAQTNQTNKFISQLSLQINNPIVIEDERLSSISAKKIKQEFKSTKTDHALAAMFILQQYLDKKQSQKN